MNPISDFHRQLWDRAVASPNGTKAVCGTKSEAISLRHQLYRARANERKNLAEAMEMKGGEIASPWDDMLIQIRQDGDKFAVCISREMKSVIKIEDL